MGLKKHWKTWVILATLPLLISCANTETLTKRIFVKPDVPVPEAPRPLNLNTDIRYDVITRENIGDYLNEIKHGDLYVFYAMSVEDYEKMALNLDELKRYIKQQQEIINYYKNAVK